MVDVFVGASNTITSLGFSTAEHVKQIKANQIGISIYPGGNPYPTPVNLLMRPETDCRSAKAVVQ